ncbi:alpha/beta hydrolase [Kitasatospora sp. GP82]|uniref:alpha/beta fold hydrolase n=1 Tax=Kitasatospora sp. GP82 TaxID=3035089 RepID=UPI0032AF8257
MVFVHGACVEDGAWWWHRMVEPLKARGLRSVAVELTSAGRGPVAELGDLDDDIRAVREVLVGDDEPAIVVAHSYGGMVATGAAAGVPAVRHLVYVTSVLPEPGETLGSLAGAGPGPWMAVSPDGTLTVRPEQAAEIFLHDCEDPEVVAGAVARLVPQSLRVLGQSPARAAWRDCPSTYAVCAEDRGTPPQWQRERAARADRVVELPTGHHPFLSHPGLLADLLAETAG